MPDFTFPSAQKVYESLAPKPAPEPPRIVAARQLLENTPPEARDDVAAAVIRQAKDIDEVHALHAIAREMLAADTQAAEQQLVAKVTEALKPPEPAQPYLDDDARLRDPAGNLVDVMGTDWHGASWYPQAADLLRDAGYEHTDPSDQAARAV
jgi:hypothetical protein